MENENMNMVENVELALRAISEKISEKTTQLLELQSELTSQMSLGTYSEKSLEIERMKGKILGLKDARFILEMAKNF